MSSNHPVHMGRREFLIASSVSTLAAVTVGPSLFASPAASPKRLAVGFAPFDQEARIIAASDVPAGDGAFISRGARITVAGVSGAPDQPAGRRAVELLAHFSYFDGAVRREAPFRTWACSRATGCQGSPVSFNIPLDEQSIRLSVGVESGPATNLFTTSRRDALTNVGAKAESLSLTLTLLSEPETLKLTRGYYAIVPLFEGDSAPQWTRWGVGRSGGRMALCDAEGAVAPFEHFILKVDYAS